jgi:hypothetical protein
VFEQMCETRENAQWVVSWVMGLCSVWYAGINIPGLQVSRKVIPGGILQDSI